MPFDTACPDCSARLRLDAPPAAGAPVECPKCGALFVPPRPKKTAAAGPPEGKPAAAPKMPKKRKAKKKKTNPVLLVGGIAAGFASLIALGFGMVWFLNRAGKVEEMLTYVPGDCNWARGVNVSQLAKYPGYAPEVSKHVTADVKAAADALADAAGHNPDKFLDYFVVAKAIPERGAASTVYVLYTQKAYNAAAVTGAVGGGPTGAKSTSSQGVLAGATLYTPKPRLLVIVPKGSESLNAGVTAGPDGSFAKAGLDACGRVCVRGSIWLVGRTTGRLKNYVANLTGAVKQDLAALADAGKAAPTFGVWTTPGGGGVRVGVAMQCSDAKAADTLAQAMKDGPLGKGDESEAPNSVKQGFGDLVGDKRFFSEVMQMLSYRTRRECAYLVTSATEERAKRLLDKYNSPTLGTDPGQPPAGLGAGPGSSGPPGGGPSRGGVGGIAPPSMAGPGGP